MKDANYARQRKCILNHGGSDFSSVESYMAKHTIEISSQPYHLAISNERLQLINKSEVISSIPCDEIGMVVIDNAQTTYTHRAIESLSAAGAVVVICGSNHLPTSLIVPLAEHREVVWRLQDQINCSIPRRKRLWQQIVRAKIRSQAANLPVKSQARQKLRELAKLVTSGDKENIEAQAAKIYWQNWLGEQSFGRDQDGNGPNILLNYGYAILRASVSRSIVAAGLTPMLGIHHRNRSNAFCLADDLMEPLRAIVDCRVRALTEDGIDDLSKEAKRALLSTLTAQVSFDGTEGPLCAAIPRYIASVVSCLTESDSKLKFPTLCL